jgi:hypothetical protein
MRHFASGTEEPSSESALAARTDARLAHEDALAERSQFIGAH